MVILDCCFSGTAALDADTTSIREFATGAHGRYLMASAEHLGLAPAGQRHTAFTGALLSLLEHGDPRGSPVLTLDAIFDGIYRALRDTRPRRGRAAKPVTAPVIWSSPPTPHPPSARNRAVEIPRLAGAPIPVWPRSVPKTRHRSSVANLCSSVCSSSWRPR
ncbi:hypothetical protein ACFYV7_38965 [Nocardia suismassiliense]|uniref:Caspase domain-containing protein n=1 Tax=Nocardia suismassiliense TaxID=2077092 RepID=A0ABW6R6X8_9NOCA